MEKCNKTTKELLLLLQEKSIPGVSTLDLAGIAWNFIKKVNGEAVFHTKGGFPSCICTCVNEKVVHGVPSDKEILKEGDIISIDAGIGFNGFCGDTCITFGIGEISKEKKDLIAKTKKSLDLAISIIHSGVRVGDIGYIISQYAKKNKLTVIKEYTGHGVGRELHADPLIPAFGKKHRGARLTNGDVFTIEPILTTGSGTVYIAADHWTAITRDNAPCAQFEHSIAIYNDKPWVLSL